VNLEAIRVQHAQLSVQELSDQWRMALPSTTSVKLLLVLSGAAALHTGSERATPLLAGHIHLSLPGQSGELWAIDDPAQANCRLISGVLEPSRDTLALLTSAPLPAAAPFAVHDTRWLQLVQLLGSELNPAPSSAADELGIARITELLLIRLLAMQRSLATQKPPTIQPHERQLQRAVQLISNRLDHSWTLETMAAAAGMSRSAFARRFHDHVGATPMAWLNAQRVAQAKSVLTNSTLPVAQIAHQLGYSTDTVFRRNFRKATGESPSQYRSHTRRTHT